MRAKNHLTLGAIIALAIIGGIILLDAFFTFLVGGAFILGAYFVYKKFRK